MFAPATIPELLQSAPGASQLHDGKSSMTLEQLIENAQRMSVSLQKRGLRKGDRVLLSGDNSLQMLVALLGSWYAGGVAMPISQTQLKIKTMIDLLDHVNASIHVNAIEHVDELVASGDSSNAPPIEIAPEDPAIVLITSGSTGPPKVLVHSHHSLAIQAATHARTMRYSPADRSLVCMRLDRPFCLTSQILPALFAGANLYIQDRFDVLQTTRALQEQEITLAYFFPAMVQQLSQIEPVGKFALRATVVGAGMVRSGTRKRFQQKFSCPIFQSFGTSETLVLAFNDAADPSKYGSVGKPASEVAISIRDESGNEVSAGTAGEIYVRTSKMMLGYLNQPIDRNAWWRTGDRGFLDSDQYLWFQGRLHEIRYDLITAIEEVVYAYPSVKEAAVLIDSDTDERCNVSIFVVCPTEDAISMRGRVERVLDGEDLEIYVLGSLPKLPLAPAKVDRDKLRELRKTPV